MALVTSQAISDAQAISKPSQKRSEVIKLPVDYGLSVPQLVVANRFNARALVTTIGLPLCGVGQMLMAVQDIELKRDMSFEELLEAYPNLVDWVTALHYALGQPHLQVNHRYATVRRGSDGLFWSL